MVTFCRPRKWLFLLAELCDLSGNHHSFKALYINNSENVQRGYEKLGLVFHKLQITENTVSVPNNLLYLQTVLKDIR